VALGSQTLEDSPAGRAGDNIRSSFPNLIETIGAGAVPPSKIKRGHMNRTAADLAEYLGAKLQGDGSLALTGVAGPENAAATDLIYLDAPKFAARIENSAACAFSLPPTLVQLARQSSKSPTQNSLLRKPLNGSCRAPRPKSAIHATAIVSPTAKLAENVSIGPYAVIEEGN